MKKVYKVFLVVGLGTIIFMAGFFLHDVRDDGSYSRANIIQSLSSEVELAKTAYAGAKCLVDTGNCGPLWGECKERCMNNPGSMGQYTACQQGCSHFRALAEDN